MRDLPGCLLIILLIIGGILMVAYNEKQDTPTLPMESIKMEVVQVMEHQLGRFSVKYMEKDGSIGERYAEGDITLIPDVPEGRPMWIVERRSKSPNGGIHYFGGTEIHIHSVKDIYGGGWNHGKHGSGQTNVVESQ